MFWYLISQFFSLALTLLKVSRLATDDQDLEILVLRHQLNILQRKQGKPLKLDRAEKLTLAVLAANLKDRTRLPTKKLRDFIRIFQPATVLGWHRELIRQKWTYAKKRKAGRPPITEQIKDLVIQLTCENNWGYGKIKGELSKLGIKLSLTSIGNTLRAKGIVPASVRAGSIGWKALMNHYREQLLACDFFVVETIWLKTLYCFFFIELGTRKVYLAALLNIPTVIGWLNKPEIRSGFARKEMKISAV